MIQKTFENTTQYARQEEPPTGYLKKHFRARFPALNVSRRHEAVATDTIYADTPAVDNGATCAQLFVGKDSMLCDVFGMKSDAEFVNALEDIIRMRGAMDTLISDNAQAEISKCVLDILRSYVIKSWQSEPHHQHQNLSERKYQQIKRMVNIIMDRVGAPAELWLLCLEYVCYILNRLSSKVLDHKTLLEVATGQHPDISPLLQYSFYEPVYYRSYDDEGFPSESREKKGYWVGIAENIGNALTYKVLTDDTNKVITRSELRSANDPLTPNLRADPDKGEDPDAKPIFVAEYPDDDLSGLPPMTGPAISPDEIIGRTFLLPPDDKGQRFCACITQKILNNGELEDPQYSNVKFLLKVDGARADKIVGYNQVIQSLNNYFETELNEDGEQLFHFQEILGHEGPLNKEHPNYKGSTWNVLVLWNTGEKTFEPLHIIANDDPVSCAIYAKNNNLLSKPGWKRFK